MALKKIESALISVFYKDGLAPLVQELLRQGTKIYSTGGTQKFIEDLGLPCIPVEDLTHYPAILGGRVKTLHPSVFGGILGRRDNVQDQSEMSTYEIPPMDLVIVDLYPFEETLKNTNDESLIIEKIDIGGPSMIRAAAKNHRDVVVVADKSDYKPLQSLLTAQDGATTLEQRKAFAAKAFEVVMNYDIAINNYFNEQVFNPLRNGKILRYGENPHQKARFYGALSDIFEQLHGKELSYNNLVDVDAAIQLIREFDQSDKAVFAVFKHTNVCGVAQKSSLMEAWSAALAGDPESAFGGVLITNKPIDLETAETINTIFFEVLIAPDFHQDALEVLKSKKNRILLKMHADAAFGNQQMKSLLNGTLVQETDKGNYQAWNEVGARATTEAEKADLIFANLVCKHLKSNAIALVKDQSLIGKGCGQTSRIDALRQALQKAKQFNFDITDAVLASDAFFPFSDCVEIGAAAGISAFIQPGGSIRDKDSIDFVKANNLAMVLTEQRHFKH